MTVNDIHAGLYLRMSEDKTGLGLGIARQRADCCTLCEQRGWTVVAEFVDNDVSASTGRRRPAYENMLQAIRDGVINAVVVWDLDRLTRRTIEIEHFIELADQYQVRLASVGGDVDLATDNGRLFARIKGAVARAEIERKSARQRAAARQAIAAGKHTGGLRAFGYTKDLNLDPQEAPLVAEMFRRWNMGATLGELVRWLNGQGVRTARGNTWTAGTVRQMLANPRFAGLRGQRKAKTDDRGRVLLTAAKLPQRETVYTVNGARAAWPAIVDEATWRAAVERLADPERKVSYRGRERRYLLPGLARCGWVDQGTGERCGQRLRTSSNNHMRVLKCPTLKHVNRRADMIEAFIVVAVHERLRRDDAADLVQRRRGGPDLRALQDEAAAIRDRRERQRKRYAAGLVTDDEYDSLLAETGGRLREIDGVIATAGRIDVLTQVVVDARDLAEVWPGLPLSTQRGVVDALMVVWVLPGRLGRPRGGEIDPATVLIEWR